MTRRSKLITLALLWIFSSAGALASNSVSEAKQEYVAQYPDVWYRPFTGFVYFPPEDDKRFLLPSGLPEILIVNFSEGALRTFFGGKVFPIRKERIAGQPDNSVVLRNGELIRLRSISFPIREGQPVEPTLGNLTARDGGMIVVDSTAAYPGDNNFYAPADQWEWHDPQGAADSPHKMLPCDPIDGGLKRIDKSGNVLWRKAIVAIGRSARESDFSKFSSSCFLGNPRQRLLSRLSGLYAALADDTFLVMLDPVGILRVQMQDGRPKKIPPNVRILSTANLLRQKLVLFDWWREYQQRRQYEISLEGKGTPEGFVYMTLQYYLFPELLDQ